MKASLPTLKVVKEAFTDYVISLRSLSDTRQPSSHGRQRAKVPFPEYMKAPFLYLGARKGAFMYPRGEPASPGVAKATFGTSDVAKVGRIHVVVATCSVRTVAW